MNSSGILSLLGKFYPFFSTWPNAACFVYKGSCPEVQMAQSWDFPSIRQGFSQHKIGKFSTRVSLVLHLQCINTLLTVWGQASVAHVGLFHYLSGSRTFFLDWGALMVWRSMTAAHWVNTLSVIRSLGNFLRKTKRRPGSIKGRVCSKWALSWP